LIGLPLINGVDCFVKHNDDDLCNNLCEDATAMDDDGCGDREENGVAVRADEHAHGMMDADDNTDSTTHKSQQTKPNGSPNNESWHILPLSRVLLRGIATAIDRRPNGCTLVVLDDGTGSMDCRYWDNSQSSNGAFHLPALLPEHEGINNQRRGFRFAVGDSLEVMGKIKTLTAGTSTSDACGLSRRSSIPMEVRCGCVREVHATSVCLIDEGPTRMANQWNGELVHWLKCMEFSKRVGSKCNTINDTNSNGIRNGKDVLPLLGDAISSSILGGDGMDFSAFDNAMGKTSVLTRKCCQTPQRFRNALFYCHCEATLEALDPSFQFRDALLNHLLDMEMQLKRIADCTHPSATEDCMDLFGASNAMPPPLLFTFESIYKDEELALIAMETVASTSAPETNVQRLVRRTFAAMTKDGILSLYDAKADLYLFVSRNRVTEPFLRRTKGLEDGGFGLGPIIPQPFFIRSVPGKRISEIMNWIDGTNGS